MTLLLLGVFIVLFFVGRTAYKIYNFSAGLEEERSRYASMLFYDFSSRVDSVKLNNDEPGPGTVYCSITNGTINYSAEDSLAKTLVHHTRLRFNETNTVGHLQFIMPGAERWEAGDSLVVNSQQNVLTFFRKGKQIYSDQFSNLLEGRVTKGL
ncbi:MAG TPA: hypothetical protein VGD31_18185 [Sphingobacteriaceae bacterium]